MLHLSLYEIFAWELSKLGFHKMSLIQIFLLRHLLCRCYISHVRTSNKANSVFKLCARNYLKPWYSLLFKDQLADQRGGSEREPIKISSKKNRVSPKITTKDSPMNLPRSRSHNGPTNPKSKPKLEVK
jgi:hypothetical protein